MAGLLAENDNVDSGRRADQGFSLGINLMQEISDMIVKSIKILLNISFALFLPSQACADDSVFAKSVKNSKVYVTISSEREFLEPCFSDNVSGNNKNLTTLIQILIRNKLNQSENEWKTSFECKWSADLFRFRDVTTRFGHPKEVWALGFGYCRKSICRGLTAYTDGDIDEHVIEALFLMIIDKNRQGHYNFYNMTCN